MAHMGLHRKVGAQASQVFGLTKTAEKTNKTTLDVETPDTRLSSSLDKIPSPNVPHAPLYYNINACCCHGENFYHQGVGFSLSGEGVLWPEAVTLTLNS